MYFFDKTYTPVGLTGKPVPVTARNALDRGGNALVPNQVGPTPVPVTPVPEMGMPVPVMPVAVS